MFNEPGSKVRGVALFNFILSSIIGIAICIYKLYYSGNYLYVLAGIPLSIFISWLVSIVLYAFGELCCDVRSICDNIYSLTVINEKRFPDLVENEDEGDD